MTKIFFDLDGTLINSQIRMYNLFCELCPESTFSYEKYWKIKRNRINQKDFLEKYFNYSNEKIEIFKNLWMLKIEHPQRLIEDRPFEGIDELLKKLSKKYELYVVTNRQSKELAIKQIESFGWSELFKKVLVTEQKKSKVQLIKENVEYSKEDILIGDTGEDIKHAKELGIKSMAVTWGFLNAVVLKEYFPDIILEKVEELENNLL